VRALQAGGNPHATTPPEAYCGYDCSGFHPSCPVQFYPHGGGSRGGTLWCGDHRIAVDLEACARRCTLEEAETTT